MFASLSSEIRKIDLSPRQIRQFAYLLAVVCLAAGLYLWKKDRPAYLYVLLAAALPPLLGWVLPSALKPFYWVWMIFGLVMGKISSFVVLSLLFFAAFTGVGVLGRLFGSGFLSTKIDRQAPTYWQKRKPTQRQNLEKQF